MYESSNWEDVNEHHESKLNIKALIVLDSTFIYDEDMFLVNQMIGSDVKTFDSKLLPSKLTVVPVDKPGQSTVISYSQWKFGIDIPDEYFTTNYMKRIH